MKNVQWLINARLSTFCNVLYPFATSTSICYT